VLSESDLACDCSASADICSFIWASSTSIFAAAFFKLSASRVDSFAFSPLLFNAVSLSSKAALILSKSALASCATSNLTCISFRDASRSESALHVLASLSRCRCCACCNSALFSVTTACNCSVSFDTCILIWAISPSISITTSFKLLASRAAPSVSSSLLFNAACVCSASFDICTLIWAISASISVTTSFKLCTLCAAPSISSPLLFNAASLAFKATLIFNNFALASMAALNLACVLRFEAFWPSSVAASLVISNSKALVAASVLGAARSNRAFCNSAFPSKATACKSAS